MKMIKMALLGGAALTATAVAAQADDLDALKAQIETLNARVAAMEAAPAVPAGYQLVAISTGQMDPTPGLDLTSRQRLTEGNKATIISVMPTADAPAGTTISWSGYVYSGVVYNGSDNKNSIRGYSWDDTGAGAWVRDTTLDRKGAGNTHDTDVVVRGQLKVKGTTDTAVGEVGVELKMRADFNGNGTSDVYMKTAWGYWAMTPELTLGGGYSGSLGNVGYGYDGACTCILTDSADVGFNPGDTTQMRLTYGSGPFSMGIALEDASIKGDSQSGDKLGVAGMMKYTGDAVSGSINGVWRDKDDNDITGIKDLWQAGAGIGFALGDIANLSIGGAFGEGAYQVVDTGEIVDSYPLNNKWWGLSALASAHLADSMHAEVGVGYKHRKTDSFNVASTVEDFDYNTRAAGADIDIWGVLGGIYYDPVDQLTIGLEGEWYQNKGDMTVTKTDVTDTENVTNVSKRDVSLDNTNWTVDLVAVWRF